MPNEDFTRGLIQFCLYLEKYKTDYKLFVHQSLTSLLKFVTPTLMQYMYTATSVTSNTISTSTFHRVLYDFFVYFNEDFLLSNCITLDNSLVNVSTILKFMIEGKFDIIDVKNSNKVEYKFDTEELVTLNCILDNLVNFSKKPNTNVQAELNSLKSQLEELQKIKSNSSDSPIIINKFENLPENFEDSKRLLMQELGKKLVNINHISNFKLFLENKTAPPSLFFDKFPQPFLPCDPNYISEFNSLIVTFQIGAIELGIRSCTTKLTSIESNISAFANKYHLNENIKTVIADLEEVVANNHKEQFLRSVTKINSYQARGYLVKPRTKSANNSFSSQKSSNQTSNFKKRKLEFHDETVQQPQNHHNNYVNNNNYANNNTNNRSRYQNGNYNQSRNQNNRNQNNRPNNQRNHNNNQSSHNNGSNNQQLQYNSNQQQQHIALPQRNNNNNNSILSSTYTRGLNNNQQDFDRSNNDNDYN